MERHARAGRAALLFFATSAFCACTSGTAGTDGGGGYSSQKETVAFAEMGTLELLPSQVRELHLTTDPGAEVRLLLIGDAYDGSLDQGVVVAAEDGSAKVTLKAPSKPSSFHVVAHVGANASDDLPVAVSEQGFATVRVVPGYTGVREITKWSASVSVGLSCAEVTAHFPDDLPGALPGSSPPTGTPIIKSVPVGPTLAVAVRSGALMWGCTEIALTTPQTTTDVAVVVTDRPLLLDAAALDLTLGFAPPQATYDALLNESSSVLIDNAFPQGEASTLLLDAMRENLPLALVQPFDDHRTANAVDSVVSAELLANAIDPRAILTTWALLAVPTAPSPTPLAITGSLIGSQDAPGYPVFHIATLGPVAGLHAGVPDSLPLTWLSQPGDTVVAGGKLTYSPTRYTGALMEAQAVAQVTSTSSAPDALASLLDCQTIGADVGGFPGCDAACGQALCVAGLTTMWERGLAAEDGQGSVDVAISATADVDAQAVPVALAGSWVGNMTGLGTSCPMMGDATAVAIPPP